MRNRKKKSSSLTYSVSEILIPTAILGVLAIVTALIITNANIKGSEVYMENTEDVWEQAYRDVEKNRVGIEFDPIVTSEDEYEALRVKCNEYISNLETSNDQNTKIDANLDVDTVVKEEQFIDGLTESSSSSDSSGSSGQSTDDKNSQTLTETGPVYFQDMLMIRYISYSGDLVVVIGAYNSNGDIEILRQGQLESNIEKYSGTSSSGNLDGEDSSSKSLDKNFEYLSESEYLNDLSETLEVILKAYTNEEIEEAETRAINYFTLEGKQAVFGNKKRLRIGKDAEVETIYIVAGKSVSSKSYKDRVYTQIKISVGEKSTIVNIILKLNSNLRIYDIDII